MKSANDISLRKYLAQLKKKGHCEIGTHKLEPQQDCHKSTRHDDKNLQTQLENTFIQVHIGM